MRKTKTRVLVCVALLLLAPILIQPGKAIKSGDNLWYEYWGNHKEYEDNPENVSTTTTVYDETTWTHWAKVAFRSRPKPADLADLIRRHDSA